MIREAFLAVGVVLAASAAGSGDNDFELRLNGDPNPEHAIKDKGGRAACESDRRAIAAGRVPSIPPDTPTECVPHPGFFTPEENCIKKFNCR